MSSTAAEFPLSSHYFGDASQFFNDPSLQWPSACGFTASQVDGSNYRMANQPYACQLEEEMSYPLQHQSFRQEVPSAAGYYLEPASVTTQASCPRSFSDLNFGDPMASVTDAYPPSAYQLRPQNSDQDELYSLLAGDSAMHLNSSYEDSLANQLRSEPETTISSREWRPLTEEPDSKSGMLLDTPAPDDGTKSESGVEEAKEEPYAQLLNRCLREAPGHTMVLRDIYHWFVMNTDKSRKGDTKGWQNSIRHNLSMNAAFQKVDLPGGQDAKKGTSWRLTETAIREGVKSTTRYRSKLPNKRGGRSQHPAPQRQASGAREGQAARKAARRRTERLRETNVMQTTDPYAMLPTSAPASMMPETNPSSDIDMQYSGNFAGYPYFVPSQASLSPSRPQEMLHARYTPSSATEWSFPGTPEQCPNILDFASSKRPLTGSPLFYNSEESGDEAPTPASYEEYSLENGPGSPFEPVESIETDVLQ